MRGLESLLGIDIPLLQAPMAGAQGSKLAIAVCKAGGLGALPCAMLSVSAVREEIATIRRHCDKPFNVNFFCHASPSPSAESEARFRALLEPYYRELGIDPGATGPSAPARAPFGREMADLLDELRPPVVSFHFGLPAPDLLERVKGAGAVILASATTVEEAVWLEARGVDVVVAQGAEAGGHRGIFLSDDLTTQVGTLALVPQVGRAVKVPVVAAGGIADAAGIGAAMALGASGVQIGTAYLLCPEAATSAVHRAALKSEGARHTALTNVFTGRPARGIVNRLVREIGPVCAVAPPFPLAAALVAPLRARAEKDGRGEFSSLWSGQNATGCKEISATDLTRELARGFRRDAGA